MDSGVCTDFVWKPVDVEIGLPIEPARTPVVLGTISLQAAAQPFLVRNLMAAISRREILFRLAVPSIMAVTTSGCGTLLYPERRSQPRGGKVDWTVVGMDSIGLFFFFIPGVIAFAIDYGNGSLFLPPEHASFDGQPIPENSLKQVSLGAGRPTVEAIETALLQERQIQVQLSEVKVIRRPLQSLNEFPVIAKECALHS